MSDLHLAMPENRDFLLSMPGGDDDDFLVVAGDVAEMSHHVEWGIQLLASRYRHVAWVPGNHELWTLPKDQIQLRGQERYRYLVEMCRELGVVTPEDPPPIWEGSGPPIGIVPLFVGYDYSFHPTATSKADALAAGERAGVVCTDEFILDPVPFDGMDDWCRHRVRLTEDRLASIDPALPLVVVNHYPLVPRPTRWLHRPDFAAWCGTTATEDWCRRFNIKAVVYGHLHMGATFVEDGVCFYDASLGYPREWRSRPTEPKLPLHVELDWSLAGQTLPG